MYDIHLQNHIVIHKVCKSALIRNYTAHLGCCKKDIFGLFRLEEGFYLLLTAKIKFLMGSCYYIGVALSLQFTNNGASNHTSVACYVDFAVFFHRLHLGFEVEFADKLHVVVYHYLD